MHIDCNNLCTYIILYSSACMYVYVNTCVDDQRSGLAGRASVVDYGRCSKPQRRVLAVHIYDDIRYDWG